MGITLNKKKYDEVADNKSATSFSINGIDIKDKPVNATTNVIKGIVAQETGKSFTINKEKYLKELEKNQVQLNKYNSEEEINKQKAKNQSWIEQTGKSLAQIVGNEVVLGSLLGFTNIYDTIATGIREISSKGENINDFTSQASLVLEQAQDAMKERLAIYRENPNQAFDVLDFGWWADNFVTVGSTLSLLIPTLATTKGISALGRIAKGLMLTKNAENANKAKRILDGASGFSKTLAKGAYKTGLTSRPATLASQFDAGLSIGANAVLQRTLENWQEAREVYKSTYEDALNRLTQMEDEDKSKFLQRNPNFEGKSNEEIASLIAEKSGYKTFGSDYAMLLMDIVQFAGLKGMYRGLANREATANLKIANENAKRALGKTSGTLTKGGEELTDIGKTILQGKGKEYIKNNIWNRVKEASKSPFNAFYQLQVTEGIEEGYQGIMSEKGKEVADLIFDPNTDTRALSSYMSDPHIWEQAFWGMVGGLTFSGAGKAFAAAERKITGKINKNKLSEADFNRSQLTDEKLREIEILGRSDKLSAYVDKINKINEGKNPYVSESQQKELDEKDIELLKSKATNDFITDLALDAADNGNFELLMDFINSQEFIQYLKDNGIYDQLSAQFNSDVSTKMKDIVEDYRNNLYTALEYAKEDSPYIANIIARYITRQKLTLDDIQSQINELNANNDTSLNNYNTKSDIYYLEDYLNALAREKNKIDSLYLNKEISKAAYDKYNNDFIKELEAVANNGHIILDDTKYSDLSSLMTHVKSLIEDFKDLNKYIFDEINNANPDKTITDAANQVSALEATYRKHKTNIPVSNKQWEEIYELVEQTSTKVGQEKLINANKRLSKYITEAENPEIAYQQLLNGENVYEGVQNDLELIKIGHEDTKVFWAILEALSKSEIARREEVAQQESQPTNNGEPDANQSAVVASKSIPTAQIIQDPAPQQAPSTAPQQLPAPQQRQQIDVDALIQSDEVQLTPAQEAEINKMVQQEEPGQQLTRKQEEDLNKQLGIGAKANQITTLVSKLAKFIKQLRASVPEINEGIKATSVNSVEFQKLYDEVKYLLEEEQGEIEDEVLQKKIIYKAIESALKDYITAYNKKGKSVDSFNQLITSINNGSLLSRISLALEEDKTKRDEVLFEELKEYVKQKFGLQKVSKNTKRAVNLIEFFNYLGNKENATIDEILVYYRFINEYVDTGIFGISFTEISKFKEGFEKFNQNLSRIEIQDSNIDESSFAISEIIEGLDKKAHDELIFKIATGQIKPQIYIEQNTETYEKEGRVPGIVFTNPVYPTVLDVCYYDETGKRIRLGYLPKARILGPDNTSIMNMGGLGFLFQFDGFNCNFDELFEVLEDAAIEEEGEYFDLYEEVLKYARNPKEYKVSNKAKKILNLPIIKQLISDTTGLNSVETISDKIVGESLTFFAKVKGGISFEYDTYDGETSILESEEDKVITILSNIYKIIKNSKNEINPEDIISSYSRYKLALRKNMLNNIKMQEAIYNGQTITANVFNLSSSIKLNIQNESHGINEAVEFSQFKDFPIIFDIGSYNGLTEDGKKVVLPTWNKHKRLSMLVYDKANRPYIAPLDRMPLIESGSGIIDDVKTELKSIIKEFLTEEGLSYQEATNKLLELLQGNEFNKLFSGIKVKTNDGITYIQSRLASQRYLPNGLPNPKFGTYFLALNKYAKEDKKAIRTETDHYVLTHTDETKHAFGRRQYKEGDAFIEHVVNSIVEEMSFNLSTFAIDNTNPNGRSSQYFYKENGKIVINIGGNKRVYSSYSEFIHKENAAKTYVYKGDDGNLYTVDPGTSMGLSNITYSTIEKMFDVSGKEIRTLDQLYEDLLKKDKTQLNTRTLFTIAGVEQDIIDILLGKNTGVQLIPQNVFYYSKDKDNDEMYGAYIPSTGEILLGNKGFKRTGTQNNRTYEVIRTLIHEHFHKLFNENAEKDFIKNRVNDLISTLYAFNKALISDKKDNKIIKKTFAKFIDNVEIKDNKIYVDGKVLTQKETLEFVEEWLVESLTQPLLSNYLNNTKYEGADISSIREENKSIFQKIVDAIINLFNNIFGKRYKVGKIQNNTIFAKQYLILSDKLATNAVKEDTTKPKRKRTSGNKGQQQDPAQLTLFGEVKNEIKDDESKTSPNVPTVSQEVSPVDGEQIKPVETIDLDTFDIELILPDEDLDDSDEDLDDAVYSTIGLDLFSEETEEELASANMYIDNSHNPNGVIEIENMNDFLNQFNEEDKLKIANLLQQGTLKYHCE